MPKFQVYTDAAGKCRFRLRADNNKIVAVGEAYEQHAGCINGIKSIQKNCNAQIEDTTVEGKRRSNPKFQVYRDTAGEFRFRLSARNGEVIADSQGYETKEACLNAIEVVGKSCEAEIEDLTGSKELTETTDTNNLPDSKKQEAVAQTTNEKTETSQIISTTESKVNTLDNENEILEELKKIRISLEKAPPPVPPKGFVNEFKDFLSKYKIFGLAVAFILALYAGLLVQALVKDFIIPLLGLLIPGMSNLASYAVTVLSQSFAIGDFLIALITFIIVALVVFVIVKVAKRWKIE